MSTCSLRACSACELVVVSTEFCGACESLHSHVYNAVETKENNIIPKKQGRFLPG